MGKITHSRFEQLVEMGREPINLPYEIYFNGNETLQKTPGAHHLEQYRSTGTYNHPNVKEQRKRETLDYAKRLLNGKMSGVTLKKIGGVKGLNMRLQEFGMAIDDDQTEIINMNASFLESEYAARKQDSEDERKKAGREEVKQEPKVGDTEKKTVEGAKKAATTKLSAQDDLSSGDENEKEKAVKGMTMPQLQKELKARGIKQEFGQTKEDKQELLLKNL